MRRASLAVLLLVASVGSARADVAPFGWRAPPAPEEMRVATLRGSLAEWMSPAERARLDAERHPRCGVIVQPRAPRSAGYGGVPCPDAARIRDVAIDRGVRFFAAETLEAQGRVADARALRALPPMRDAAARRQAVALLARFPALEPARRLAADGGGWSPEHVAVELGRAIRAAVEAGAPRDRLVAASLAMLGELARPFARHTARAEVPTGSDADRRFAVLVARASLSCLEPEAEARWRPVAIRVGLVAGRALSVSGPDEVRACIERAARAAAGSSPASPPTHPIVARIVVGPPGLLWGEPVDLDR